MKETIDGLKYMSMLVFTCTVGGLFLHAGTSEGFVDTTSRAVGVFLLSYVVMKLSGFENKSVLKGCATHAFIPAVLSTLFLIAACNP